MRRSRLTCLLTTGLALLLGATLASAAHHESGEAAASGGGSGETGKAAADERKPWDQARMTELSQRLATETAEVRRAFRREPNFRNPATPNQRTVHQMEGTLRNLETATRRLARSVADGGDHDGTVGTARRIGMLLNDADVLGRGIMTSAFMAEKIRPAMATINEIAPYYGSGPLFDPETMQRLDRAPNPDRPAAE